MTVAEDDRRTFVAQTNDDLFTCNRSATSFWTVDLYIW
jgi:hypothetical protein